MDGASESRMHSMASRGGEVSPSQGLSKVANRQDGSPLCGLVSGPFSFVVTFFAKNEVEGLLSDQNHER